MKSYNLLCFSCDRKFLFSIHPGYLKEFDALSALALAPVKPCDILLTPSPADSPIPNPVRLLRWIAVKIDNKFIPR